MKRIFFLAIALALCACATNLPATTPAQGVFAARGVFSGALDVANRYKALPPCGTPMVIVCSTPAVVTTLQQVANSTNAVLDSAEATVRNPAFAGSTASEKALAAAQAAVEALTAITGTLKLQ